MPEGNSNGVFLEWGRTETPSGYNIDPPMSRVDREDKGQAFPTHAKVSRRIFCEFIVGCCLDCRPK